MHAALIGGVSAFTTAVPKLVQLLRVRGVMSGSDGVEKTCGDDVSKEDTMTADDTAVAK